MRVFLLQYRSGVLCVNLISHIVGLLGLRSKQGKKAILRAHALEFPIARVALDGSSNIRA